MSQPVFTSPQPRLVDADLLRRRLLTPLEQLRDVYAISDDGNLQQMALNAAISHAYQTAIDIIKGNLP